MPIARTYKAGSVIYFEKEKSDKVFILKEGKVILRYTSIEENFAEKTDTINPGQFFGVKSAVGSFPREETATAAANCKILILSVQEFEQLAAKNMNILMKMLRVFSNQLRNVHSYVRKYLTHDVIEQRDVELFKIGDFYMKNKRFDQAGYIYSKYLEYYPDGELADEAKLRFANAKKGMTMGINNPNRIAAEQKNRTGSSATTSDPTKAYYEAVSMFSKNKFREAANLLSDIVNKGDKGSNNEFYRKSFFQLGKCYLKMNEYDNAIDKFSNFIKKYPDDSAAKEAVFNIGLSYKNIGETEKAKGFFNKVMSMGTEDKINLKAQSALEEIDRSE